MVLSGMAVVMLWVASGCTVVRDNLADEERRRLNRDYNRGEISKTDYDRRQAEIDRAMKDAAESEKKK